MEGPHMKKSYVEFCQLAARATQAGFHEEAIEICGQALSFYPDNVPLLQILATSLSKKKRHYESTLVLHKVLEISPRAEGASSLLAKNYVDMGAYKPELWKRAIEYADRCLEANGKDASGLVSKAYISIVNADYQEAFRLCQAALKISPDSDGAVFNISIAMLANHMWEEGWYSYNKYLHPRFRAGLPEYPIPMWNGEPGKLIVTGEQGLGDVIMFASMIPDLQKDHEIIFDTIPKISGLLGRSFDCRSYGTKTDNGALWKQQTDADFWVPIGSLGAYFRNSAEDFPGTPYLKADPERRLQWKALLDSLSDKPKIGIAWSGGVADTGEKTRSMELRDLFPILEYDADWISLQYKNTDNLPDYIHHWPRAVEGEDYDDTAALIAELDLVISVTTAAVHCAGALGIKTWALVPGNAAWRYGTLGEKMPWYRSVDLIRQENGAWPIQEVCDRLSAMNIGKCRNLSTRTRITVLPRSTTHRLLPPSSENAGLQKFLITGLARAA